MPSQEDIARQQERLSVHRHNLAHYLRLQALHGEAFAPPYFSTCIDDERTDISGIKATLNGWSVAFEDFPDDEAPTPSSADRSTAPPRPRAARPALWIGLGLAGALLAGLFIWKLQRPDKIAATPTSAPATAAPTALAAATISVDTIRDKILLAPYPTAAESILSEFWSEGHSGFHANHHYDPAGCSDQGYGLAWNIHYDGRFLRDRVLVFSTPKNFTMLPGEGAW